MDAPSTSKTESSIAEEAEMHRTLHSDPENGTVVTPSPSEEQPTPKRRQPFKAVWIVIACGFALMSDGIPLSQIQI